MSRNIMVLGTGGTIAGEGPPGETAQYQAATLPISDLLGTLPPLPGVTIESRQLLSVDSCDISTEDWLRLAKCINDLAARGAADGFVVTHGTDTLDEAAYFLNLTVRIPEPVILTGAMRPSTATSADGPMNLYESIALAANDAARGKGVLVVFSDGIYGGREVQKGNTFKTDAFNQGEFGAVGYMRDTVPYFFAMSTRSHTYQTCFDITSVTALPKVSVVYFHADADPGMLRWAGAHSEGVVIAGAGSGGYSHIWQQEVRRLNERGIPVVRASRIGNGIIIEDKILDAVGNTIPANTLSPQKARILLSLSLTITRDYEEIRRLFSLY
ncbi:MAG: asparaginase [Christensenellales bacterium]|jgi:L-asparaginase